MAVETFSTSDAATAAREAGGFLHGDPIRHNVVCTLLAARSASATPIRFWWATVDGEVRGAVFQSPDTFPALVSRLDGAVVAPLAAEVAAAPGPALPGVDGPAADVSRFAGELATVTRRPARPVEGQRLYEIERVQPPSDVPGGTRVAADGDVELITAWLLGFGRDTGLDARGPSDAEARAAMFAASGRLQLWVEGGEARACAFAQPPASGVVRVGFVYTPPEQRRRGFASALVAALSQQILDGGERCILYTQLSNPTSNAIYQRIGYAPVEEMVRFDFE